MKRLFLILAFLLAFCNFSVAIGEDTVSVSGQDTVAVDSAAMPDNALFHLPENYLETPNPKYETAKHGKLEFWTRLAKDKTSILYLTKDIWNLTLQDSIRMFLPFDTRNLGDYTVKAFGIKAKYIDLKVPMPEHFHIDINKNPIHEKFPWEVVIPVIIGILLVLYARFTQDKYISRVFLITAYHNAFQNSVRERNVNADKAAIALFLNYLVNAPLLATICLYRYNYQFSVNFFMAYLTLLLVVLAVYWVKRLISWTLGTLFDIPEIFELHYRNVSYSLQATGVMLLVLNVVSLYVKGQGIHDLAFYLTAIGCAVMWFLKNFRLLKIIIDKHFSYFYLFLYLCAVEILPVLLVIKFLSL
ncbi:MAG: DUF4271 domain-containing protein [Bacteroidales bacterium]|nr:DUF4271 domain-containing protein [Bacteroidales bacterium]